jgi:hypothetical protein
MQAGAPQWRSGQTPPPYAAPTWGAGQPPPPGAAQAQQASSLKWVLPVVLGAVAVVGLIVFGVVYTSGKGRGGGGGSGLTIAPAGACGNQAAACVTLKTADPHHVDPLDILPQARKLALGVDSRATLTSINVTSTKDGTVDIAAGYGTLSFMFSTPDGTLAVTVRDPYTSVFRGPSVGGVAVTDPRCPMKAAHKAVVAAGAPVDKSMTIVYQHNADMGADVWFASAQSRMYYVDSVSCAVKKAVP